jgi:hypothetical protein
LKFHVSVLPHNKIIMYYYADGEGRGTGSGRVAATHDRGSGANGRGRAVELHMAVRSACWWPPTCAEEALESASPGSSRSRVVVAGIVTWSVRPPRIARPRVIKSHFLTLQRIDGST